MTSTEIQNLKLATAQRKNSAKLLIEGGGEIPLHQFEALKILNRKYTEKRLEEFKNWFESSGIAANGIAEKLGIHPVIFSQLMNGTIRSNKKVGTLLQFIEKVEALCKA